MAASAYLRRSSSKAQASKETKILIEAYQFILNTSNINSVFRLGDVVSTSARGVESHSGVLVIKWRNTDAPKRKAEADIELKIEIGDGILIDLEDQHVHRIKYRTIKSALDLAHQATLAEYDAPPALIEEARRCLGRFDAQKKPNEECASYFVKPTFMTKKVYVRVIPTPKDVCSELMAGRKKYSSTRGVTIELALGKDSDKTVVAVPIFKVMKSGGTTKTPEQLEQEYARRCKSPMASPTELCGAILAKAYLEPPKTENHAKLVQIVAGFNKL